MFKVILLAALVSAAWTKGYPTVNYESDSEGDDGLINDDDIRPQYRQPIYQTQVEYNDEDEQDLVMEDEPIVMYEQKSVDAFPKRASGSGGYHKPGSKQGTYKGSDISQEIKHKKQTYESTKVSQEHVEVKSVSNDYGSRLPNSGKNEAPKAYKPSSPSASKGTYKSPSDTMDYAGHIGQSNKEPATEYKHNYAPQKKNYAPVDVQQDNVEVDFKSQSPPPKVGSGKTGYQAPIQQTLVESGIKPGHYGHQGGVYMGYSVYNMKNPYERPNNPPPQTYGIYREGPKSSSRYPSPSAQGGEGKSSYHNSLGGSGAEYPGIGSIGGPSSPSTGHGGPYKGPNNYQNTYNNNRGYGQGNVGSSYHQTNRGAVHNAGTQGIRSGNTHSYNNGGGSRPYSRPQVPSTHSSIGHINSGIGGVHGGSYSNHGNRGNVKTSINSGYSGLGSQFQRGPGYHGPHGSSDSHGPYNTNSVKSHGIKHPYSGGSGSPISSSHSGIKTSPGYHGSQSGILPVGNNAGKTSTSSGSYRPKPNYPPPKISQEKHSDDYPSAGTPTGGSYHSKGYPQPKISQEKHSDDYPSVADIKPQAGGIGETGYIGKGESPRSYSKGNPVAVKPSYPAPHHSSGVKGTSYEPKGYSGIGEIKSATPSHHSPSLSSGSSYKPPTPYKGHSIKGGPKDSGAKGGPSAEYEDTKSQNKYQPITATAGGSSSPSYKPHPVESSSKYEPPKVEQEELSYESLLGGHGSQSPGAGTGGYGFTSNGSPSGDSSNSGYGSHEEPSKPMPYEFKYEVKDDEHGANQYREEKMDDNGYLTGRYGYRDAHGLYREVEYQASKDGFKVNNIKTNEPGTDNQDPADVHFEVEKNGQPQY